MRVLLVNTLDAGGGAAQASVRLFHALRQRGVDATLLVQQRSGDDPHVIGPQTLVQRGMQHVAPILESQMVRRSGYEPLSIFSPAIAPDFIASRVAEIDPDVVHLNWVQFGMLRIESLRRLRRPIVWTLHDSWAFTGGCHIPFDSASLRPCVRNQVACGRCPVLNSHEERDLSRRVWLRKQKSWRRVDMTIVAPSRWLASCAKTSSLLSGRRVEHIPNGLDLSRFRRMDIAAARHLFGLPAGKKLVLFGAQGATTDLNKGFHLLREALHRLRPRRREDDVELVVFGAREPAGETNLPYRATYVGWLQDEVSRNALYAAADVLVAPSLLENLPFTIMEAMAAGTPAVAFRQGGVADLVDHLQNGYLARAYEADDLAHGIEWVLADGPRREELSQRARAKTEREFDVTNSAEAYARLYGEITALR